MTKKLDKTKTTVQTETPDYVSLLGRLKAYISETQYRVAKAVNTELVELYWNIGHEILEQQKLSGWGNNVYGRIADDLRSEMGSIRGFSRRNLTYMCQFARLWPEFLFAQPLAAQIERGEFEIVQPVVGQIGWTQNQILMDHFGDDLSTYIWYAEQSAHEGWSKRQLETQIALELHKRQGKAITNFSESLESPDAQAISQLIKDPYIFDFLSLDNSVKERQLEDALLTDIQKLLLELGTGFAFYGRQKSLIVSDEEFFLDLIFYHHVLRRFIVIELKAGKFKPEYSGKMNFYLNAVDMFVNVEGDKESIGIILCSDHNDTTATVSLSRIQSPIAVSTWKKMADTDPEELKALEEIEDVQQRLVERINMRLPELEAELGE